VAFLPPRLTGFAFDDLFPLPSFILPSGLASVLMPAQSAAFGKLEEPAKFWPQTRIEAFDGG
jgi:hypothetical protein